MPPSSTRGSSPHDSWNATLSLPGYAKKVRNDTLLLRRELAPSAWAHLL
jgi:hypothetical protein